MKLVSAALLPLLLLAGCSDRERPSAGAPPAPPAPAPPDTGGVYVLLMEEDTLLVERYSRRPGRLEGEFRDHGGDRVAWSAEVGAGEVVERLELRLWRSGAAAGAPPVERSVSELREGRLVRTDHHRSGRRTVHRAELPAGAMPYFLPSVGLAGQVLRRSRVLGERAEVPIVLLRDAIMHESVEVRWLPGDSALLSVSGNEIRLSVDSAGRILGGVNPMLGIRVVRAGGEGS